MERPPQIVSAVMGCQHLFDCQLEGGSVSDRFSSDVQSLETGETQGPNGLTVRDLTKSRVAFGGSCTPDQAGACALQGRFLPTTPEMVAAQDQGLETQQRAIR